jgi:hypothetical protein
MRARAVSAHIVHPVQVNQRLLELERARGAQIMRFVLLMERSEDWPIDDIRTDSAGIPIGVTDERGTAEQRLSGMLGLERLLNSQEMAECIRSDASGYGEVAAALIDVMAQLRTGRFVLCLHFLSTLSPPFVVHWLSLVDQRASMGDLMAHVLRERILMLKRANMIKAVFSREAAAQVVKTLEKIQ